MIIILENSLNSHKIKHWVFDLDNTLYPSSSNLFSKIDIRMKEFIIKNLNLEPEEAYKIQKQYYLEYGTTLSGLMKNHNVLPKEFLEYVHNIDASSLEKDVRLGKILKKLPGDLYIYTNGSTSHAINIMKRLEINNYIDNIFDIEDANYIPKPSKESLDIFVEKFNINPLETIFFEDISKNLINAKKIGFQTVLIKSNSHPDINTSIIQEESKNSQFIDHISYDLPSTLEEIYLDINS